MGQNGGMIGLLVIIVFVVFYMILTIKKQQKSMLELEQRLSKLKEGDKVKTYNGFYGVIKKIYDTTDGKIVTINISQNDNECLVDVNMKYIAGEDKKQVIEYDENMNVISLDGVPVDNETEKPQQTTIDGATYTGTETKDNDESDKAE